VENDRFTSRLSAFKDGELDENLREEVSLHLRGCEACRKELAELEQVDSLVRETPKLEPGRFFSLNIVAGISAEVRQHPDSASFPERFMAKVLELTDPIFELISGRRHKETAALDEFGDFPPLSMSYAYFHLIGQHR